MWLLASCGAGGDPSDETPDAGWDAAADSSTWSDIPEDGAEITAFDDTRVTADAPGDIPTPNPDTGPPPSSPDCTNATEVHEGPFTIEQVADIETLSGFSTIAGDLIVHIRDVTDLSVDCLQVIEGELRVASPKKSNNERLTTLTFPALTETYGLTLEFNDVLSALSLPALQHVGGDIMVFSYTNALTGVSLPALETVAGDFVVQFNSALTSMPLPSLHTVDGDLVFEQNPSLSWILLPALTSVDELKISRALIESLSLPALAHADQLSLQDNPLLAIVDGPLLVSPGGLLVQDNDVLLDLGLPLETVGGDLHVEDNPLFTALTVSGLQAVDGDLTFKQNPGLTSLELPALLTVGGDLYIGHNPALFSMSLPLLTTIVGDLDLYANVSLAEVTLPALTSIKMLSMEYTEISSLSLPALITAERCLIRTNPQLTTVSVPALEATTSYIWVEDNAALPELTFPSLSLVDDRVTVRSNESLVSLSMPALNHVTRNLEISDNPVLTNLDFPELTTMATFAAHCALLVQNNPALTGFSFPQLTLIDGHLEVRENATLAAFSLPVLETITRSLTLVDNPALTGFSLSALGAVAEDLEFSGNPALAQCLVDDLLDQLNLQGGIGGEVSVLDTDEGCSCETNDDGLEATCP